jgi:hypothetical protein
LQGEELEVAGPVCDSMMIDGGVELIGIDVGGGNESTLCVCHFTLDTSIDGLYLRGKGRRTDPKDQDHEKRKTPGETSHVGSPQKKVPVQICAGAATSIEVDGPVTRCDLVLRGPELEDDSLNLPRKTTRSGAESRKTLRW